LLVVPASVTIAGTSAARVWGVRYGAESAPVEVHSPTPYGPVRGLIVHTGPIAAADVTQFRGVPVTTAIPTAWDIARRMPCWQGCRGSTPCRTNGRPAARTCWHDPRTGTASAATGAPPRRCDVATREPSRLQSQCFACTYTPVAWR
jgi:hypothetical protein